MQIMMEDFKYHKTVLKILHYNLSMNNYYILRKEKILCI